MIYRISYPSSLDEEIFYTPKLNESYINQKFKESFCFESAIDVITTLLFRIHQQDKVVMINDFSLKLQAIRKNLRILQREPGLGFSIELNSEDAIHGYKITILSFEEEKI